MKNLLALIFVLLAGCGSASVDDQSPVATAKSFVVPQGTDVDWVADCPLPDTENAYQMNGTWVTDGDNLVTNAAMPFVYSTQNCSLSVTTTNDWGIANQVEGNCSAHAKEIVPKIPNAAVETQQVPFSCQNGDTIVRGLGTETTSLFHVCQQQIVTISDAVLSPGQRGTISMLPADPNTLTGFAVYAAIDGPTGIVGNPSTGVDCGENPTSCGTDGYFIWEIPFTLDYWCDTGGSFLMSAYVSDGSPDQEVQGCSSPSDTFFITCLE